MLMVTIPDLVGVLEYGRSTWPGLPIMVVGHSLGGSILLESLDPVEGHRNPRNDMPDNFTAITDINLAVVLGASLQPEMAHFRLPHREEDTVLNKPDQTELEFIAAEFDGIATPKLMTKTAQRYSEPPPVTTIPGGNHWGWVNGVEAGDGTALDGAATISKSEQQDITADLILEKWNRLLEA